MLFLDKDDFVLTKSNPSKPSILKNRIDKTFSLIMFSGNDCVYCKELKPIFKKLVGTVANCQIGTVNVSLNPSLINISQQSTTPIKYVPLILFYVNGFPFKEFGGNYTEDNLRQFIKEVSDKAYEFAEEGKQHNKISVHSIGIPVSKRVCYLSFEKAYTTA